MNRQLKARRAQEERATEEHEAIPDSLTPEEERQHRRRAAKSAYLERNWPNASARSGTTTTRAIAIAAAALCVAVLPGCGSSSKQTSSVAGNANADAVQVIKSWADELRAGDISAASDKFAIPSFVQNGSPLLQLTNRRQIETFNQSLPCGARLTAASRSGRYTIATFVLTERPGPGRCGNGVGDAAKTAFVIQDGHIREWRRVVDTEPTGPTSTEPVI